MPGQRLLGHSEKGRPDLLCAKHYGEIEVLRAHPIRRRELMVLLGGALIWSRAARAQHKAMTTIGFLGAASPGPSAPNLAAFRQGLSETGYVEGQNLVIEYRWAEDHYDRLPALAADLVGRKVDLILAG